MEYFSTFEFYKVFWTISVGALGGVACSLLGCFLILKRLSLLGDAISHGVLPGIAVAVLLTQQIGGLPMMAGAMVFGLLTAWLTETLTSRANVTEDASLGIVFTSLFAVGVVIISTRLRGWDLDLDCVLLGHFSYVPLNTQPWFGFEIPHAAPPLLLALSMTVAFVVLFWKELKLAAFDAELATAMGFSSTLLHYLFVGLVAICTVTSFESMGSVLVLAMLVVPPATAHLLTDRLVSMLLWAAGLAVSASALGYVLASAAVFNCNVGGMIATVAGGQFMVALALAPRHGIVARAARQWRLAMRIACEEILGSLYRDEEAHRIPVAVEVKDHHLSPWLVRLAFFRLRRRGWIVPLSQHGWRLTAVGKQQAESVVRSHRLWETFLVENFELPLDHVHAPAARIEHFIGPQLQNELAAQLQEPQIDPHGKQIP